MTTSSRLLVPLALATVASVGLIVSALVAGQSPRVSASVTPHPSSSATPTAGFYVDPQNDAQVAARNLTGQARTDALALAAVPTARWFTGGTPAQAESAAAQYTSGAAADGSMPVLVVYYIPGRDCGDYSTGGATSTAAYRAWIDGLARGIGSRPAMVMVEPDSLGLVPWYRDVNGALGSCNPSTASEATAASERFAQLKHAVDALTALPATKVYLDGTNPGWLAPGDAATRLRAAGVDKAAGFFTNVANFYSDAKMQHVTRWISDCLYLMERAGFAAKDCPGQYTSGVTSDVSTWSKIDGMYARLLGDHGLREDAAMQKHAVWDTGRNGQGDWTTATGTYPDNQAWCNPPDRGLGRAPSASTGDALVDARLWIKTPGGSDGSCLRGTAGPADPLRGVVDPTAGQWFPALARELIANANPALR